MAVRVPSEGGEWGTDSRTHAVRERWRIPRGWQIPHGIDDAEASSHVPWVWWYPCTSILLQHLHSGHQDRDRERPHGQRVMEVWANWNGGHIPYHVGEGKERIFKGKFWRTLVDYQFPGPLLLGGVPSFHITFCFPNKSLLNSLMIFLTLNFLSGEEKKPISLDSYQSLSHLVTWESGMSCIAHNQGDTAAFDWTWPPWLVILGGGFPLSFNLGFQVPSGLVWGLQGPCGGIGRMVMHWVTSMLFCTGGSKSFLFCVHLNISLSCHDIIWCKKSCEN
jgi:hypothetical protein